MTIRMRHPSGFNKSKPALDLDQAPVPTIMAKGLRGSGHGQYTLQDDGVALARFRAKDKPPYRVPPMAEVAAMPWNGLTVASTFAGCGGSSTGYRMAGYRILWASEFVPAAQASYRANMREGTILDGRDVRLVTADEMLKACGLKQGQLDVFDGSPPCQAFSTAGKRHKGWGTEKKYEHGAKQKNEDLFFEYIRLLRGLMPRAFVAENVSGLVKGVAKGYFLDILAALKACGYVVEVRVLDAQWLGVPQARQRVIFQGVRGDLGLKPAWPAPLPHRYSVRDAIPWISKVGIGSSFDEFKQAGRDPYKQMQDASASPSNTILATGPSMAVGFVEVAPAAHDVRGSHGFFPGERRAIDRPFPTVTTGTDYSGRLEIGTEKRKFTIAELKRICSFPDDFVLTGTYAQQWERLGNSVPPLMMRAVAMELRDRVLLPARERDNGKATRHATGKARGVNQGKSPRAAASRGASTPRPVRAAPNDVKSRA